MQVNISLYPLLLCNVMISLAILLIDFHPLRLTLNTVYSCHQRQMVQYDFMPFTMHRTLNSAALTLSFQHGRCGGCCWQMQWFYYQNRELAHKILIKPKNRHTKYKVPGSQWS